MRYQTDYIIKKMNQLIEEMETLPDEKDHGWEWENLLALTSQAKEKVRKAKEIL